MRDFSSVTLTKFSVPLLLAAAIAGLAGCRDNTEELAAQFNTTTNTAATPASVALSANPASISAASTVPAASLVTAIVKDSTGFPMDGITVYFVAVDPVSSVPATLSNASTITASGVANTTLMLGTNLTQRTITVAAKAGAVTGSTTVTVTP